MIPLTPFQRRYRELRHQGITASEIAANLGWDCKQLLQALGFRPYHNATGGKKGCKKAVKPAMAKRLAQAMWSDPVDLGF